eukprot:1887250-Pleurochrysis_carterae.AAC.1
MCVLARGMAGEGRYTHEGGRCRRHRVMLASGDVRRAAAQHADTYVYVWYVMTWRYMSSRILRDSRDAY